MKNGIPQLQRNWLNVALRVRPARLARAIDGVKRVERLGPPSIDYRLLKKVDGQLRAVAQIYRDNDPLFKKLFDALRARDESTSRKLVG